MFKLSWNRINKYSSTSGIKQIQTATAELLFVKVKN